MKIMNSALSNKKWILVLLASVLLAGCRGSDETDVVEPRFPVTSDPDAFGAFLNQAPGVPRDGAAVQRDRGALP